MKNKCNKCYKKAQKAEIRENKKMITFEEYLNIKFGKDDK